MLIFFTMGKEGNRENKERSAIVVKVFPCEGRKEHKPGHIWRVIGPVDKYEYDDIYGTGVRCEYNVYGMPRYGIDEWLKLKEVVQKYGKENIIHGKRTFRCDECR